MCTLITLVGMQPGAVATAAKTLSSKKKLQKIVLLFSKKTQENFSSHLISFLNEKISCDIEPLCFNSDDELLELISKKFIEVTTGGYPPVYFFTSPGLNYQVALISHHLKDKPVIPLYADYKHLYNLNESTESWPLKDIGLVELLRLHGYSEDQFRAEWEKRKIPLLKVAESRGHLYGLTQIWRDRSIIYLEDNPTYRQESDRIKQVTRNLEALLQFPKSLNYLQPRICVWTNDYLIYNRVKAYEIEAIMDSKSEFTQNQSEKKWEEIMTKPPGWFRADRTEPNMRWGTFSNDKGTWQGENLIVALGNDPSSTLLSIFTHEPAELVLLVDDNTPWVKTMAGRIFEQRLEIPAKEINFLPFDLKDKSIFQTLETRVKEGAWAANISPGTKAQTWILAKIQGVRIWSLKNEDLKAVPLIKDDHTNPISYSFPSILLQAKVVGGRLNKLGISQDDLKNKAAFLIKMINVIAKRAGKSGSLNFLDEKNKSTLLPWSKGKKVEVDQQNFIRCLEVDEVNTKIKFEACYNQKESDPEYVNCENTIGHWLEEPVAGAFLAAGGNRIKDIRAGVRWDWLHKKERNDFFRTDIDVLLNWKGVYIGISCKLGGSNKKKLEDARAEIMAEARAGLGRFALPVLVRGGIKKKEAETMAKKSIKEGGPLEIGLCVLNQPGTLNTLVEEAINNLRTLNED